MSHRVQELLDMLAEESAEVIQITMKINRHGIDSYHPNDPSVDNRKLLRDEMTDLLCLLKQVQIYVVGDITETEIEDAWNRKLRYTRFQKATE
jgi:NTP pyrophosphatase (non-canonical NTP hydrolase)